MENRKENNNGDKEIMVTIFALTTGFVLDLLLGDPRWLYHPVRLIGTWISFLEKRFLKIAKTSPKKQLFLGGVLWILVVLISAGIPAVVLWVAGNIHPVLAFVLESFWCYQLLAAKCLSKESKKVYDCLVKKDLEGARYAVSMIVGRDTKNLTEEGITKAAVETVAENTSDGVVAPLLFMMLGGAPLGFFYKAVNTMDSMVGYKNEKYLYFGRVAAKMDDVMNYLPSRISAVCMVMAAFFTGMDAKQAWRIFRRDRRKHASPNSAQTESVCAGALNVQLAGDAWYHGVLHKKEYIGDAKRPIEAEDIRRAGRLMYGASVITLILFGVLRCFIVTML